MDQNPLANQIRSALREVIDPEVGINVIDLGLVYDLQIQDNQVRILMTMTSPACPLNSFLSDAIKTTITQSVPQVRSVEVKMVWEPPWSPEKMSEKARRQLGF
jgi:metal-sulfur cluster biosynthetic enzyme